MLSKDNPSKSIINKLFKEDLTISFIHNLTVIPSWRIDKRRIDEYLLIMGKGGEAIYETDEECYTIKAGTILLIEPGVTHRAYPIKKPFSLYSIRFKSPMTSSDKLSLFLNPANKIPFIHLLEEIQDFYSQDRDRFITFRMCTLLIKEFLLNIHAVMSGLDHDDKWSKLEKTRRYMESHPEQPFPLSKLAGMCGLSASYFSKQFTNQYGMTPKKYISRIRLNHGYHLLTETTLSVKETASRLGYSDAFIFSHLFKEKYGLSPSQVRKPILP